MGIVLHIGTHRTGTTSIQRFAAAHRDALERRGLWYPSYGLVGAKTHYAHHHLAHALAGQVNPRLDPAGARRFVAAVCRRSADVPTTLLSAEPFYRHTLPTCPEPDPAWPANHARYIAQVRAAFGDAEVEVLLVLRRQDAAARSLYSEQIEVTRYPRPFADFVHELRVRFAYDQQVRAWQACFPRVRVRIFEDLQATGDLVGAFFAGLGVAVQGLARAPAHNASWPADLVEYKRQLNGSRLSRAQLQRVAQRFEDPRFLRLARLPRGAVDWLPPGELARFLASFAEGNAWVRAQVATGLPRPTLFPDGPVPVRPQYPGLSEARWRDITAALLQRGLRGA